MCQENLEIHFCTCVPTEEKVVIHNKNSRRFKKDFDEDAYLKKNLVWKLFKYEGYENSGLIGMIIMPSNQLTSELTADYLIGALNSKNLFDFDYQPQQGDNLKIEFSFRNKKSRKEYQGKIYSYMSFIFKDDKWTKDYYIGFNHKTVLFREGKVEIKDLNLGMEPKA